MENRNEILLGLTTTPNSDWRGKIEEMKKFGIKRIALFPTFLEIDQRKELYSLLEQIEGLQIPHVHLRTDMENAELEYFISKFNCKVFNVHPASRHRFVNDFSDFSEMVYLENTTHHLPKENELKKYAGLCIDFSHWENAKKVHDPSYAEFNQDAENYRIGCCHVSAIMEVASVRPMEKIVMGYDKHFLKNLSEVDYLKKYKKYLPAFVSLELENSFAEQLEVKAYLEKLLEI